MPVDSVIRTPHRNRVLVRWRGREILVHWDRIRRLDFACLPRKLCTPLSSCCATYEVTVSPQERRIIDGLLPLVAKYLPDLRVRGGFENLFEPAGAGLYAIEQDERGTCRFAYRRRGTLLCSIHLAAIDLGVHPARVKPRACTLWPLWLIPRDGHLVLTLDPSSESFACVRLRSRPRQEPCPAVADIIRGVLGDRVLGDLLASE